LSDEIAMGRNQAPCRDDAAGWQAGDGFNSWMICLGSALAGGEMESMPVDGQRRSALR
jgi:hypothetical protein